MIAVFVTLDSALTNRFVIVDACGRVLPHSIIAAGRPLPQSGLL